MDSKTQNVLFVIMLGGLFVGGFFLYNQQKMINEIKGSVLTQRSLQGGVPMTDDNSVLIEEKNIFIASGKIDSIKDNIVSFRLKVLNGESFSEPLEVMEAVVTKDTSFKIFVESKNGLEDDIENLADGSMRDLVIDGKVSFYFEKKMVGDRFEATKIVIIK